MIKYQNEPSSIFFLLNPKVSGGGGGIKFRMKDIR